MASYGLLVTAWTMALAVYLAVNVAVKEVTARLASLLFLAAGVPYGAIILAQFAGAVLFAYILGWPLLHFVQAYLLPPVVVAPAPPVLLPPYGAGAAHGLDNLAAFHYNLFTLAPSVLWSCPIHPQHVMPAIGAHAVAMVLCASDTQLAHHAPMAAIIHVLHAGVHFQTYHVNITFTAHSIILPAGPITAAHGHVRDYFCWQRTAGGVLEISLMMQ